MNHIYARLSMERARIFKKSDSIENMIIRNNIEIVETNFMNQLNYYSN